VNGDLFTWSFPALEKPLEGVLKTRSGLVDSSAAAAASAAGGAAAVAASAAAALADAPFRFSRFNGQWLYQLSVPLDAATVRARKVTHVSVGLVTGGSAGYFPSKYNEFCKLLLKAYTLGEPAFSPLPLMQIYLSVLTTNKFESASLGKFEESSFDQRRAMIAPLKFLIQLFGAEGSITIWQAMLLRKRVFLYHPKLSEAMNLVKILPLLGAWHRQDVSLLRPFVTLTSATEMAELQASGVYVAGFTDPDCINRRDLYDLHIDAQTKVMSFGGVAAATGADAVSSSSAPPSSERPPAFALTKFHRTTGESFVKSSASESDQAVIKLVAETTKEFLDKLQVLKAEDSVAPGQAITQEGLANAGLPQQMQTWIYAVAVAEGMAKK
jgi:hypothetical protein